ncbi:MAG: UDP-glucose 4-epimerase GalE [Gammaproteobacteria bacterium]|jgi:UDP-glucose 4-epimerase|nr:UDP-glucose 4-epimerase GalE [Gammaproteobacteria bacterium]
MHAILVTGGAGYIGSHVVRQLGERGERVLVLDNLSTGQRDAVLHGELIVGDTGDAELVERVLRQNDVRAVMHFAAHIVVPESVSDPLKYYLNNTSNTRNLLACCARTGVEHFIFSSTAAVYGIPDTIPVAEDARLEPINPYGRSKLMSEWMLRDLAAAGGMKHVILRYFNVAGADLDGRIGQSTPAATHLIKVACEAVTGQRDRVEIFGTDYPTPDGSGVRDYIHVEDLAAAHLSALDHLRAGADSTVLNCGYGHGYSVREVLDMVQRVAGCEIEIIESPRRAGDPPALTADATRIRGTLGWQPRYDDLEVIVRTALAWERKLAARRKVR